jgi:hypothetical protein
MSARSRDRRQARRGKDSRRWGGPLININKKGAKPRQAAPFQNADYRILLPSREGEGLAALRSLPE